MIRIKSPVGTLILMMSGKNPFPLFLILCISVSNVNFVNSVMTSAGSSPLSTTSTVHNSHSKPLNYQEPTFQFIPLTESDATQYYSSPDNVYNYNSNSNPNQKTTTNTYTNTQTTANTVINPVSVAPPQNSFNSFVPQTYQNTNTQNTNTQNQVYQNDNHQVYSNSNPSQNQNQNQKYVEYKNYQNSPVQKFQKPIPSTRRPQPQSQPPKKISYAQSLQHHFSNFPRIPWLTNRRHHIPAPWPTAPQNPQNGNNGHGHPGYYYPGGRTSSPKRKRFIPRREKYQQQQPEFLKRSQSRFPPQGNFANVKDPRNFIFPDRRVSSGNSRGHSHSNTDYDGHRIIFSSSPPPLSDPSSHFRFTYEDDSASSKRRFSSEPPIEFMASSSNNDYQHMKMPGQSPNVAAAPAVPFLRLGSLENNSENPRPVLCAFLTESRGINGERCIEV